MGGKTSKTNRTGRMAAAGTQRFHYCPECGEKAKMTMHMPRRSMHGRCTNDHSNPKGALTLR